MTPVSQKTKDLKEKDFNVFNNKKIEEKIKTNITNLYKNIME